MVRAPDISVVIPVSGRYQHLGRALETILRQESLRGSITAELIIVDNSRSHALRRETKQTCYAALCHHPQAQVTMTYVATIHPDPRHRNAGYVRNVGLRLCASAVVLMSDADVLHVSETLAQHVGHHQQRNDLFLFSFCRDCPAQIDLAPETLREALGDHAFPLRMARHTNWFGGMCCSAYRERIMTLGGYDERFWRWGYEDYDLARRLVLAGAAVIRDDTILTLHQQHPSAAAGGGLMKVYAGIRQLLGIRGANGHRPWGVASSEPEPVTLMSGQG